MRVGFVAVSRTTDVEFAVVAPRNNDHAALVTFAHTGAVLFGQLYYQHDLLCDLALRSPSTSPSTCEMNGAALALAVYRTFGVAALERLEGDFALVIWDATMARLIGVRDPMGGYPLYWAERDGSIAFSTGIEPLVDFLPSRALNPEHFADFLMMPGPRNEVPGELCAYEGVHRVLPGSIVNIHVPTGHVERHTYWNWLSRLQDPGTERLADIAAQYADLLRAGVRERIRGRMLAHLSGGMDSTMVSLLARDLMRSGRGEPPLHTFSLVYTQLPGLARECPYLESALQHDQEMVTHRFAADDLLDFNCFADAPLHDEPYAGLWRLGMDRASIDLAAQIGAVTLLTGIGADDLLDVQPYYLADVLRRCHLRRAWQEAARWACHHNCSPWEMLRPFGIAPLAPVWLLSGIARMGLSRGSKRLNAQTDWTIPPWILPSFARRYSLQSRAIENLQRAYRLCPPTGLSVALSAISHMAGDVIRWAVAAPHGINLAHPFLDRRLLCLSLGMQLRLRPEPGVMKPVLAEAMRGILPDAIRNRRRKGHFNEVYYLGLAQNLSTLETMVREAPIDDLQMFDKACLLRCLREASMASANARQLQRLNFTLSLLKWLHMQHEWGRASSVPAEVRRTVFRSGAVLSPVAAGVESI
jgi:asparagine synthase (glutamine-hydrolysing)